MAVLSLVESLQDCITTVSCTSLIVFLMAPSVEKHEALYGVDS